MTLRQYSNRWPAGFALAASLALPALCIAQRGPQPDPTKAAPPSVYSNPRSGPEDPRVGLKPGLFDAGEAIFGLEKIASLQKPPGFAPDPNAPPPPPPPAPPAGAAAGGRGGRGPTIDTGSVNSDLAFIGNHLFVGNYNGINFYDIDNPAKIKLMTSTGFLTAAEADLPAINGVSFTRRGDYLAQPLDAVPRVAFSEAMRDLDLVVSVAHAAPIAKRAGMLRFLNRIRPNPAMAASVHVTTLFATTAEVRPARAPRTPEG